MTRNEALRILERQKPLLQQRFGVGKVGLFGSVARDEAGVASDVDVVVQMAPDGFAMAHVKGLLEEAFHIPVDLVRYREKMNPSLKERIEREAVYV
ncbi:nucleotidyltransferase family protein [Endothiovibrio diazotrophicus]